VHKIISANWLFKLCGRHLYNKYTKKLFIRNKYIIIYLTYVVEFTCKYIIHVIVLNVFLFATIYTYFTLWWWLWKVKRIFHYLERLLTPRDFKSVFCKHKTKSYYAAAVCSDSRHQMCQQTFIYRTVINTLYNNNIILYNIVYIYLKGVRAIEMWWAT